MNKNDVPSKKLHASTAGWIASRTEFLKASGLVVAGLAVTGAKKVEEGQSMLRFGIVTDAHYAIRPANGSRHYAESLDKMTECVALMNEQKVDFLIELGDFKDQIKPAVEKNILKFLQQIESVFGQFKGARYHVLGNHDVDHISKKQFLDRIENTGIGKERSYYSFNTKGVHFVVLDADYTANGTNYNRGNFSWKDTNIPAHEIEWLKADLAIASDPVVVFVHQLLDDPSKPHCIKNANEVRQILEASGKVLAVFQGHNHKGGYSLIKGIHYYTLKALVEGVGAENNSYAIVEVLCNRDVVVTGYRKAVGKMMAD
jgi:predicted phosphodiesterase